MCTFGTAGDSISDEELEELQVLLYDKELEEKSLNIQDAAPS